MGTDLTMKDEQQATTVTMYDGVVIGAGPYGLSVAAHLRGAGLNVAVFGKPLQLWREYMPKGMFLRSYWWASNLSDPAQKYGMLQYFRLQGMEAPNPLPIETFIDYGMWFQQNAVPDVDETFVASLEAIGDMFRLVLVDGRVVQARFVVMALGLHYYAYRPGEFSTLPDAYVSHTADHQDLTRFQNTKVAVIGGGQSAIETAALLNEAGARVSLIARKTLTWLPEGQLLEDRPLLEKIRSPKAATAPGWYHLGLEHFPYAFHRLSRRTKDRQITHRFAPAGASWLRPRVLGQVSVHEGAIQQMQENDGIVELTLTNGETIKVDHVILATGYRVDLAQLPLLTPTLRAKVQIYTGLQNYLGAPVLDAFFQSGVPGLYFVGISAVSSFGPFYRFVAGTRATARKVTASALKRVKHA